MDLLDTSAKLHFLMSPDAHDGDCSPSELIETHMSWVVLHGERALKLKKPVRYPFLDFSTVDAREADAREELRLNRRLAPQVYLDVLALKWRDGQFALVPSHALPAPGTTVDWIVLMQRLPDESMLDRLVAHGAVQDWQIDLLAVTLAQFYRDAPRAEVCAEEHVARLQRELRTDREVLLEGRFGLDGALEVMDRLDDAAALHAGLLRQRVLEGRIVEGHGDLRPEHVCMLQPPVVIDCLAFDPALREQDPFDELAFLGMECALEGMPSIAPHLRERCEKALDDWPPPALHALYTARRAALRARLMAAHLLDAQPRTPERWLPRARRYLEAASRALAVAGV